MQYRRVGRWGLKLPEISLGLWHKRCTAPLERSREIVRRAFELGITHFDLANDYGPPYGSAEKTFGRILRKDLAGHRDEIVVSTKAGWEGSRFKLGRTVVVLRCNSWAPSGRLRRSQY